MYAPQFFQLLLVGFFGHVEIFLNLSRYIVNIFPEHLRPLAMGIANIPVRSTQTAVTVMFTKKI